MAFDHRKYVAFQPVAKKDRRWPDQVLRFFRGKSMYNNGVVPVAAIAPDRRARIAPQQFDTEHAAVRLP